MKNYLYYLPLLSFTLFLILLLSNVFLIQWDTVGYYLYLPANFIWKDPYLINYKYVYELLIQKYKLSGTLYQLVPLENGCHLIKYTSGISILVLPFFLAIHFIVTHFTSFSPDGFSLPYHIGLYIATIFYLLVGIYFLLKVLKKIFHFKTAIITFLTLVLGTNIIYLLEIPPIVHVYAFTFYSIFLYYTLKWHESPNFKHTLLLGLTYGFILAIRPTDGIILIVFLLWEVNSLSHLKEKVKWFLTHKRAIFTFFIFMLLPITPQIIYWTLLTGKPIINSYMNPNEGFDWLSPHTIDFLFSFRKGWIIYTPMILLLIPAFINIYKKNRQYFYSTFMFLLISVYLHSSWTCWWYAESYSQRSMLQSYVVLSIPFGLFIQYLLDKRKLTFLITLLSVFVIFNLFKYYQFRNQIIHPSRMTRAYYVSTFFNVKPPSVEEKKLLLIERPLTSEVEFKNKSDYRLTKKLQIVFDQMFEIPQERIFKVDSFENKNFVLLDSNYVYTPAYKLKYSEITSRDHAYLVFSAHYINFYSSMNNPLSLVVHMTHNGEVFEYKTFETKDQYKNNDSLKIEKIELIYLTPEIRNKEDELLVYFWQRGKKKALVGPIDIEVWESK